MKFVAEIDIMPLDNLLDPQGKAVKHTLHSLNFDTVNDVRIGKHIKLVLEADSKEQAARIVDQICKKVLYNPVVQQYSFVINEL